MIVYDINMTQSGFIGRYWHTTVCIICCQLCASDSIEYHVAVYQASFRFNEKTIRLGEPVLHLVTVNIWSLFSVFPSTHKHQLCLSLSGRCCLSGGGSLRQTRAANTSQTRVRWERRPEGERESEERIWRQQQAGLQRDRMTDRMISGQTTTVEQKRFCGGTDA